MYYVTTNASNYYNKYYGYSFSVQERFTAAVDLVTEYEENYSPEHMTDEEF